MTLASDVLTYELVSTLVAEVIKQAYLDAMDGDLDAIEWFESETYLEYMDFLGLDPAHGMIPEWVRVPKEYQNELEAEHNERYFEDKLDCGDLDGFHIVQVF